MQQYSISKLLLSQLAAAGPVSPTLRLEYRATSCGERNPDRCQFIVSLFGPDVPLEDIIVKFHELVKCNAPVYLDVAET